MGEVEGSVIAKKNKGKLRKKISRKSESVKSNSKKKVTLEGEETKKKHAYLKVEKIGDIWKVFGPEEKNIFEIEVDKGAYVKWSLKDTAATFQFPVIFYELDKLNDSSIELEDEGYTIHVPENKDLKLKVKKNAPSGTIVYAVLCENDKSLAQGSTPPRIIVK